MNEKTIKLTRQMEHTGACYSESVSVTALPGNAPGTFLELASCGYSFFRKGGDLPISNPSWVFQMQMKGSATLESEGERFVLSPGDILTVPPGVPHRYLVNKGEDMEKIFLIFKPGPLLEFLLGNDIRKNGILFKNFDPTLPALFLEITEKMKVLEDHSREELSLLLYKLCFRIREGINARNPAGNFESKLRKASALLSEPASLDSLGRIFGAGRYSLIRMFRRETGKTPVNFMIHLRLEKAVNLLNHSDYAIGEIAASCGYSSPSHFASEFRKHFGVTPREFRKKSR